MKFKLKYFPGGKKDYYFRFTTYKAAMAFLGINSSGDPLWTRIG